MAIRFRKSIKIAPGVKVNLNKKSVGVTVGGKGAHYTVNSSGRKTTSVGVPGTGLSYTSTSSSKSKKKKHTSNATNSTKNNLDTKPAAKDPNAASKPNNEVSDRTVLIVLRILFAIVTIIGLCLISVSAILGMIITVIGAFFLVSYLKMKPKDIKKESNEQGDDINEES